MDKVADRLLEARRKGWQDTDKEGNTLRRTMGIASLGGATLDNEENYLLTPPRNAKWVPGAERDMLIGDRVRAGEPGIDVDDPGAALLGHLPRSAYRCRPGTTVLPSSCVHVNGLVPGVVGEVGQQPPQRRDPPGADREADVRVVGGAGELPGEVARVGAHGHPPGPGRCGQACQGAAQQVRRGRARVIVASPKFGGQQDFGLRPGRHVRPPGPRPGHAPPPATAPA